MITVPDDTADIQGSSTRTNALDAQRLANQATFGPNEALISQIQNQGATLWLMSQINMPRRSFYTSGSGPGLHEGPQAGSGFCENKDPECWRDSFSAEPLLWDFYRNAMVQHDQLRQRVAFALQQILVVSNIEVQGTYGLRNYQNTLLDLAFNNYRQVLKKVTLSPVMGDYLNHVNNVGPAPNENYARELLQLFSIGTCELNMDGSLKNGQCIPTYNNDTVRSYAFALTGWTYPSGGKSAGEYCAPGNNCRHYGSDMVPAERSHHDNQARKLLSNVNLAPGHSAPQALEKVLDSLMAHPNMAPFIAKQLISHLVSNNPSRAYVQRVANAFRNGRFGVFGSGQNGDLTATVTAVLLDAEARSSVVARSSGKLREPVLMFTGVLRALNGYTDGDALSWWWGQRLRQHLFRSPTVFNFYSSDYPVPGSNLVSPPLAIHDATTAIERLNFLTYLIDWDGSEPNFKIPKATGTKIDITPFMNDVDDAAKLVDRLSLLALGQSLPTSTRTAVIEATAWWTPEQDSVHWKKYRINTAAFLIFSAPEYHIQN